MLDVPAVKLYALLNITPPAPPPPPRRDPPEPPPATTSSCAVRELELVNENEVPTFENVYTLYPAGVVKAPPMAVIVEVISTIPLVAKSDVPTDVVTLTV